MTDRIIVAHRGLSAIYPENTALALEQAIASGVRAVEFDVQLTADRVPIVFHDADLSRVCGFFCNLFEKQWQELRGISAHYPERFGERFVDCKLLSLEACVELLLQHPEVTACIEIKEESVAEFGLRTVVDSVVNSVAPLDGRVKYLSFSQGVVEYLHALGVRETNWVLSDCDEESRRKAERLRPSILACQIPSLPDPLWDGAWDWMGYQTESAEEVIRLFARGVRYVESDNVAVLADALPEYFIGGTDE